MACGTHTTHARGLAGVRPLLALLVATLPTAASAVSTAADVEALLKDRRFFAATAQATELIEQGGLTGPALGRVYLLRGRALFERLRSREAEADFLRARELVPKGTDSGSETAYWLGRAYAHGASDRQQALALLREASRAGNADADYEIGLWYGEQTYNPEGFRALQRASRKGLVRATLALAQLNSDGSSTQNAAEAVRLYRLAAQRGDAEAEYQLALAYRDGFGVAKDLVASRSWQDKALAQGHAGAHLLQGNLLDANDQVRLAQYHYWHAAQGGLPAGMLNIGLAYLRGRGVEQDWQQATRWLSRAEGVPMADFYLGGMSLYGLGVERNDQLAFEAFQRASTSMPDAKAMLAGLYQGGVGISRDAARAQRLLAEVLAVQDAASIGNAAWMLATSERADVRQPELAVRLAERSAQLEATDESQTALAAALAAAGEFERAASVQRRVLDQASEETRALSEQRLTRYQAHEAWTEPFQRPQQSTAHEPQRKQVATFIGEVVQLTPTPAGRRPAGYEIDADSAYAIRVLVEKVESGALPHFMQEMAVFYIHSPAEVFPDLAPGVPPLDVPKGPQRFVLTEVEANGWTFDLQVAALDALPPLANP